MGMRDDVHEGMVVRDVEGQKLGRVRAVGASHFELEPHLLSNEEFLVEYADVRAVREGEVYLTRMPRMEHLEDNDGGALPPRASPGRDDEPVNQEARVEPGGDVHAGL